MKIYLGLVHHPIVDKRGDIVTTSVTNLDIHDIARSCRTFGVARYFIVTPLEAQHELVNRILGHWESNEGLAYNPDRQDALRSVELQNSVEDAVGVIKNLEGIDPLVCVTGANLGEHQGGIDDLLQRSKVDNRPIFLLFGTGWGLHSSVLDKSDFKLMPINGTAIDGYNHLSVRSAVAIYLSYLRKVF